MASEEFYPGSPAAVLRREFIGQNIRQVVGPGAVLDLDVVRRNCKTMLETAQKLSLGFRAHVKTHKTVELTRLQVGDDLKTPVKIIVSTVAEAEHQFPLLQEYQRKGREVNVLYGLPPSSVAFARLNPIREVLGPDSVSFLIDHPAQLQNLVESPKTSSGPVPIFVKVDVGYHRAGLEPGSKSLETLLHAVAHSQKVSSSPNVKLLGFYSHNSLSYAASSPEEAMQYLAEELELASRAAKQAVEMGISATRFTISMGSTPPTAAAQNLNTQSPTAEKIKQHFDSLREVFDLELHAGVYATLDVQQLATHSRPLESSTTPTMTSDDIGIRMVAEVLSTYSEREVPEALIGAGSIALGREPCKAYSGWGIVAPNPWSKADEAPIYDEEKKVGWIVGRISQEHGVLTWQGPKEQMKELMIGENVLIWPNHACMASAAFGWYYVVDSSLGPERAMEIVDIWPRCRGW